MTPILITQRVSFADSYQETRDALDQRYVSYFSQMGFTPFVVPNVINVAEQMIRSLKFHALVLTGGNNLLEYGGNAPERDQVEQMLLSTFSDANQPILGICRGMQLIATLLAQGMLEHSTDHIAVTHPISGWCRDEVNSYHSWVIPAIRSIDFKILASDPDGNIEALVSKKKPILGIMWHPERDTKPHQVEFNLLKEFLHTGILHL